MVKIKVNGDSPIEGLTITLSPPDQIRKREVVARFNGDAHTDHFNTSDAADRLRFRKTIVARFGLWDTDETHSAIDSELIASPPVEQREPPVEPFQPFPLDTLPEWIRGFVNAVSRAIGCDPSYVILPLLSALASAIGNSRSLLIKRGWSAPSILWTVAIGESGSQKSPPFRLVMQSVRDIQQRDLESHRETIGKHEQREALYEIDLAKWKKKPVGGPPTKPAAPPTPREIVSDSTVEALAGVLQGNPRGVLLARDELSGWFGSFDKYNSGKGSSDTSHWLSMYNGETLIVDRKTGVPLIIVPHASVSLSGGIQPGIFSKAVKGELRESGLLARLLLAYPPSRPKQWSDDEIGSELISGLETIIDNLRSLQPEESENGDLKPTLVRLSPESRTVFIRFYNEHAQETADLSGDLASIWSKIEEAAARLALVHYLVRWASGEFQHVEAVDSESMQAGVRIGRWFANEAKRVLSMLDEGDDERDQRRLVDWIGKRGSVTVRDVQRGHRKLRTSEDAELALCELVAAGYGRWDPKPPTPKGGPPTRVFELLTASTLTQPPKTPGIR